MPMIVSALAALAACQQSEPGAATGAPADSAPVVPSPPAAPNAVETAASGRRAWRLAWSGDTLELFHGVPQTDDVTITLRCRRGSGRVTALFPHAREGLTEPPTFVLSSGGMNTTLQGEMQATEVGRNAVVVGGQLSANDPVMQAFARTGELKLDVAGGEVREVAPVAREARRPIAEFRGECAESAA